MFQRIYNISIFSSRIYMKFHAIFAPYLDVDAYISLINICSHFFQSRNKNFLEWEETLFSLHSHLKIHSKVLDTWPIPSKQNIPQDPTPGCNFWIRACNKRR